MNIATSAMLKDPPAATDSRFMRVLPPLAALAYPGLVWCGTAVGAIFLVIAMVVPGLGLLAAHRAVYPLMYPRSRWIALAVVGTPPLYSLLGGLLDFQHTVPFKGIHVWMILWTVLVWIAFAERPGQRLVAIQRSERLAFAHGISAILIATFAAFHLANHLGGLWGGARHIAIMTALRHVYRNPVVEIVLLGSVGFQLLSGLRLLQRRMARAGGWIDSLQMASAAYLTLFFLSHLSAVLRARYLRNVDTNWVWLTADSLLTDPWSARLAPYYFLAVIALGVHGAAGLRKVMIIHGRSAELADAMFYGVTGGAAIVSGLIMTGLFRA
jgi:succinate dehydrogenase/fumarate reductase cytochrome b subunit